MTADVGTGTEVAPVVRPTHGPDTALRVSVAGPGGTADLVVPFGSDVADVAASYAVAAGLAGPPTLARPGAGPLDPDAEVGEVLESGDLLVVAGSQDAVAPGTTGRPGGWGEESSSLAGGSSGAVLVLSALAAGTAAVTVALGGATGAPGWARPASAGVLLLGALLVALRAARVGTSGSHAHTAAPALAAAAGFVLAWRAGAGGTLLALAVGGLAAAVAAAVARTGADDEPGEQVLRVWLVGGGTLGAVAVVWLLAGSGSTALAVVALAAAVVAMRVLPAFVVDVDDEVLLDLDGLAVTAWSARETPRGGRRRHQVRVPVVRDVAARARRAVVAGVVVSAGTAALAGPVVLLGGGPLGGDATTWATAGSLAIVAFAGAALGLVARSFRSRLPRRLLGLTGSWLVLLSGAVLVASLSGPWVWWILAALAVVVPAVVLTAVRLGHGWRSVWWARVGEVAETFCGIVVVALVPLAGGLFDLVRTSFG